MHALHLQPCFFDTLPLAVREDACEIQVIGIGHLAAAVRLELARRGGEGDAPTPKSPVIVVCSDFHNPASFADLQGRALEQGGAALFASLGQAAVHPRLLARQGAIAVIDQVMGM